MGVTGSESFRIARDNDENQLIYPARDGGADGVQVCGPDEMCCGRSWVVRASPGEVVTVSLQIVDAHVAVSIAKPSAAKRTAHSLEGPARHSYHIAGSFNGGRLQAMAPDERSPGVYTFR